MDHRRCLAAIRSGAARNLFGNSFQLGRAKCLRPRSALRAANANRGAGIELRFFQYKSDGPVCQSADFKGMVARRLAGLLAVLRFFPGRPATASISSAMIVEMREIMSVAVSPTGLLAVGGHC